MALELLVAEARDLPEDSIMEVIQYIRAIKMKTQYANAVAPLKNMPVIREPGRFRGQFVMTDDFDEPLDVFKEYM
ncbi:MAG: DUF2281 domain-containing protein [Clostridia bacterium]|nr:DUF2281 domain-containing protein [Clostridia bacterium]